MCAGAIVNARIEKVVYGARDAKAGAFGTRLDLNAFDLNHKPEIVGGFLEKDCAALLSSFFSSLREKRELRASVALRNGARKKTENDENSR